MNISIVGAGYVGIVTGVCLADKGHSVICVDIDKSKIEMINSGTSPFHEIGLSDLLKKNVPQNIFATPDLEHSVKKTEVTIITVGTPFDGREIDLSQIKEVSTQVGSLLKSKKDYHTVVVKSTVVPGTTDGIIVPILEQASEKKAGIDFGVGVNPEFLTEGQAVSDFNNPDRIVLGGIDNKSILVLKTMYSEFFDVPIIETNNKTAEMIKYASNAMLATCISFSNEMANMCAAFGGIDIVDVMKGINLSNYLSVRLSNGERVRAPISSFFAAGCGFGGSCLPKDVKALVAHFEKLNQTSYILNAVLKINRTRPKIILKILKKHFPSLKDKKVTVLGLAFKPDTDDVRETPALPVIEELLSEGARVKAHDPYAIQNFKKLLKDSSSIEFTKDLAVAIAQTDAIILITSWEEYLRVPEILKRQNSDPIFVDGRRYLDPDCFSKYDGIGRGEGSI